ncbi:MAG: glycoside hydrolase family 2 [Clostridia bacterium]|nr:glycoside hydrolase family 2 [Clostridia bacterium]
MKKYKELKTPFESDAQSSWESEYPRPQLCRDSYLSLCGEWELFVAVGESLELIGNIKVPFPPESRLSGITYEGDLSRLVYKRKISIPHGFNKGRIIINFGAADQITRLFVNDSFVGEHTGGYLPFSFDITDYIKEGEAELRVEITDSLDTDIPYGKQRRDRGGMWYTPVSGIWQPVWLESVPQEYIRSLRIAPTLDSVRIECIGGSAEKTLTIHFEEGDKEYSFGGDSITVDIPCPHLWSAEDPYLYRFTLTDGEDTVSSYFALRTVSVDRSGKYPTITVNGKPTFFHGLLDQGYFSDGIYLPASPDGYINDIKVAKSLGFNMLRKHIKIEPELFYYFCDKLGIYVFQDMVNSGRYSFIYDTALPTIGMKKAPEHKATKRRRELFEAAAKKTAALLYNHPSVVYYTIFNEGWGQYDADRIYGELKSLYPEYIWDSTSGWFWKKDSDVWSHHVYFKPVKLKAHPTRPLVLSEFGGYSWQVEGHIFNPQKNYGYKTLHSKEELTEGLRALYEGEILPAIEGGLCATVLTQVSDVEDETNGIMTYDRQVIKVDAETMSKVSKKLYKRFDETNK